MRIGIGVRGINHNADSITQFTAPRLIISIIFVVVIMIDYFDKICDCSFQCFQSSYRIILYIECTSPICLILSSIFCGHISCYVVSVKVVSSPIHSKIEKIVPAITINSTSKDLIIISLVFIIMCSRNIIIVP